MQIIPESSSVQLATCKALNSIILESEAHMKIAMSLGVVDATICLILVHPHDVMVLQEAIKVLGNLCDLKSCLDEMAEKGGITTVIDAMRSNSSSVELIITGAGFIRSMNAQYADASSGCIIPIISCMNSHPESKELIVESCCALKSLVAKSEYCKERVLVANGRSILEKIITEKKYIDTTLQSNDRRNASVTVSIHSLLDELC